MPNKFYNLLILSFFLIIFLNSSKLKLTEEYLLSQVWSMPEDCPMVTFLFDKDQDGEYKNGYFTSGLHYEGYASLYGQYHIEDNKLYLKILKAEEFDMVNDEIIFELRKIEDSIYLTECLCCISNNSPFYDNIWNEKSIIPEGSTRIIDGYNVISVNKTGKIIDRVYLREKPSINSKKYVAELGGNGKIRLKSLFLTSGHKIKILYRTENKEKIRNWNNYWYYILISDAAYGSIQYKGKRLENNIKNPFVWIYGEFIRIFQ